MTPLAKNDAVIKDTVGKLSIRKKPFLTQKLVWSI